MSRVLENIEPQRVFYYFEELSRIPHGSGNTKQISDYCVSFAREHGLNAYQDSMGNVIIFKTATPSREDEETIILQGHLDMVCEVEPGFDIDMSKAGLELFVEGDLIGARHTTLGGDDGIAIAIALAILEDDDLSHPALEAVFTVDEEIGMLGASYMDASSLHGHTMLNIDSEEEGVFTVSCAGGVVARCTIPVEREAYGDNVYEISIAGLTGGHSGIEIDKRRANANKLMARILWQLQNKLSYRIISVAGGLKDNAIPVASSARISTDTLTQEITEELNRLAIDLKEEYCCTDPGMKIVIRPIDKGIYFPMSESSSDRFLEVFYMLPEGIIKMSNDVDGLVQTSLNMGILDTLETEVTLEYCVRSSVDREKYELIENMREIVAASEGQILLSGDYSGWEYREVSPLREAMVEIYRKQYGNDVRIEAVHAGVECGIFASKIDDLDCISYGPNLSQIHTYRERMSISSVKRVYKMTRTLIEKGIKA